MKIEVIRNTFWEGQAYEVGQVVDVSESTFDAMIAHGKARPFVEKECNIPNRSIGLKTSEPEAKVTKRQWRKKPSPTSTED